MSKLSLFDGKQMVSDLVQSNKDANKKSSKNNHELLSCSAGLVTEDVCLTTDHVFNNNNFA